jgi:hypothetical protein
MKNITPGLNNLRRNWTRKERRDLHLREMERIKLKGEIYKHSMIFKDRTKKQELVKRMEHTKSFQEDLMKMKDILIGGKQQPLIKPDKDFFKSKTDIEVTGFDNQFKKKKDFLML